MISSVLVAAAGVGLLVVSAGSQAASAATPVPRLLTYWQGPFVVRPTFIDLTPTAGETLSGTGPFAHSRPIKWSSWTRSTATGKGILWIDSCLSTCAGGPEVAHAVTIHAYAASHGRFTRLTVSGRTLRRPQRYKIVVVSGFGGEFRLQ